MIMKRIDFEHGTVTGNILGAALPMLVAQILSLLYNIVDRIYIARIPSVGTTALGAVVLMVIGMLFASPILVLFGASEEGLSYAYPYMMIYSFPFVSLTPQALSPSNKILSTSQLYHTSSPFLRITSTNDKERLCDFLSGCPG